MRIRFLAGICFLMFSWAIEVFPTEEVIDLSVMMKIREEGLSNSKVMETAGYLCDVIGPRLTGSPAIKRAHEWTRQQMESWGLANAHLENWSFGRGWSYQYMTVHLLSPDSTPLLAFPRAWTPGTNGPARGKVVLAKLSTDADLEKFKGKLAGLIVLTESARELPVHNKVEMNRYSEENLEALKEYPLPSQEERGSPASREEILKRRNFRKVLKLYLQEEKVLAVVEPAQGDGGTVRNLRGGDYKPGETFPVRSLLMAPEHYNRLVRLLDRKMAPELELDVRASFHDEEHLGYNTIAELPGTDKKEEIVMAGGHLDSWHLGTGATDDAAGCSVAMEAMRILKAIGAKPRRTIRVALWGGEEQGLLGSKAYVTQHLAAFPETADPEEKELPSFLRPQEGPLDFKPEYSKLSAYFNLDNGGGRIRGIYSQDNLLAGSIFEVWLKSFSDLGAKVVTNRKTDGTDHLSFHAVGLPGFQFIQDELEYSSRTWHTNMDVYDRLLPDDLKQAAVVLAAFLYNAAMREEMIPRRSLPGKMTQKPAAVPAGQK